MRHGRMRMVEGVFMNVSVVFPAMGRRRTIHSRHLRREVGRSLRRLWAVS